VAFGGAGALAADDHAGDTNVLAVAEGGEVGEGADGFGEGWADVGHGVWAGC